MTECKGEPFLVHEVSRAVAAALITFVLREIVSVMVFFIDTGTVQEQ